MLKTAAILKPGTLVFFTPGQKEVLNIMFLGGMKIYLPCSIQVGDISALEAALDPEIEQLVFIGTKQYTGMESGTLASLIKSRRLGTHPTKVVLLSSSPEIIPGSVDDFVDVLLNYPKILRLANEMAERLH